MASFLLRTLPQSPAHIQTKEARKMQVLRPWAACWEWTLAGLSEVLPPGSQPWLSDPMPLATPHWAERRSPQVTGGAHRGGCWQ